MISSESPVLENSTPGLMSGGEETWLRPRLRHRHTAKAAGNSYSLEPTAGRASPRLYALDIKLLACSTTVRSPFSADSATFALNADE